jgi:hypothetical protein
MIEIPGSVAREHATFVNYQSKKTHHASNRYWQVLKSGPKALLFIYLTKLIQLFQTFTDTQLN